MRKFDKVKKFLDVFKERLLYWAISIICSITVVVFGFWLFDASKLLGFLLTGIFLADLYLTYKEQD